MSEETRHTPSDGAKTPMCPTHPGHFLPCNGCQGYGCAACDNAAKRVNRDESALRTEIEALADALTEDNTYDDAALMSPNVSVSEAQTYPAIISERTSVIQRLRAALDAEVTP